MRKASVFALMLGIMLPSLAGAYTTNTLRPAGIKTRIEFDTNQDGTTVTLNESGVTLSDAAGVDSWAWFDSAGSDVGNIDSNGNLEIDGAFLATGNSEFENNLEVGGDLVVVDGAQATSASLISDSVTTAALLTLDHQINDASPFTNYKGVVGSGKSLDTDDNDGDSSADTVAGPNNATWNHEGMIAIQINGVTRYIPYYSKP